MNRIAIPLLAVTLLTSCKDKGVTQVSSVLELNTQLVTGTIHSSESLGRGVWTFESAQRLSPMPRPEEPGILFHVPIEYRNVMSNFIGKRVDVRLVRLERPVEESGGNYVLLDIKEHP